MIGGPGVPPPLFQFHKFYLTKTGKTIKQRNGYSEDGVEDLLMVELSNQTEFKYSFQMFVMCPFFTPSKESTAIQIMIVCTKKLI